VKNQQERASRYRSIAFALTQATLLTPPVVVRKAPPKFPVPVKISAQFSESHFQQRKNVLEKLPVFFSFTIGARKIVDFCFRELVKKMKL